MEGVERFETLNSVYEIDRAASRVRRVSGVNEPTSNQGADGEWKEYVELLRTTAGSFIFYWPEGGATITSTVVSQR